MKQFNQYIMEKIKLSDDRFSSIDEIYYNGNFNNLSNEQAQKILQPFFDEVSKGSGYLKYEPMIVDVLYNTLGKYLDIDILTKIKLEDDPDGYKSKVHIAGFRFSESYECVKFSKLEQKLTYIKDDECMTDIMKDLDHMEEVLRKKEYGFVDDTNKYSTFSMIKYYNK